MKTQKNRTPLLVLALILAAAFALRLMNLDAIRHNIDHAYPIWQAMRTIDYGVFPVVGQATSVLFANPALTGYLYIPALLVHRSPVAVYILVIILNTAAVAFAWQTARVLFKDWRTAALTALIIAFNPWIIEYSRTTWVQSLMPFFVCGTAALLATVITRTTTRSFALTAALLGLLTAFTQTYLLGFFLVIPTALLMILFRKRLDWRAVGAGFAFFVLITGIYLFSILSSGSSGLERVEEFAGAPSQLSSEALTHGLRLVSGEGYTISRIGTLPDAIARANAELVAHLVFTAALIAGVIAAVHAVWKRTEHLEAGLLSLIWFWIPILAMSYTGNKVHPFYLLLTLPAGAMLAAWGVRSMLRWRISAAVLIFSLSAWAVLGIANLQAFADQTRQMPTSEQLNALPLRDGLNLGAVLDKHLPQPGIVYSSVNEWILNSFTGRLFPVISGIQTGTLTYVPYSGGINLVYVSAGDELPEQATRAYAEVVETIPFSDGSHLVVESFPKQVIDTADFEDPAVPSDAGVSLLDYTLRERRDGVYTLVATWQVDQTTAETGQYFYGSFLHVFDDTGERIANVGGQPVAGLLWNSGDVMIDRLRFTVEGDPSESGPARFELGLYDINSGKDAIFSLPQTGEQKTRLEIEPE